MIPQFIKHKLSIFGLLMIISKCSLLIGACVKPQASVIPEQKPGALYTIAAETAMVHLAGIESEKTQDPSRGNTTPIAESDSLDTTATPAATNFVDSDAPCDQIRFVKDVTILDDQELAPGETFTKTWRLQNAGTCTWTIGYVLVFEKGDALGAPASVSLTNKPVPPGETVDVSVKMKAPESVGSYQGYWKIRNVKGETFGLGEYNQPFWVKINVVEGGGMMFDFNVFAQEAAWGAGADEINYTNIGDSIVYFDQQDDPDDPAVRVDQEQILEGGRLSGILLITKPAQGKGNYLIGRFPVYTVNNDDLLVGRVGLRENAQGKCSSGALTFLIDVMIEGDTKTITRLWEGDEVCDGRMQDFEIALDAYQGDTIHVFLTVISENDSIENSGVWDSLAVQR